MSNITKIEKHRYFAGDGAFLRGLVTAFAVFLSAFMVADLPSVVKNLITF